MTDKKHVKHVVVAQSWQNDVMFDGYSIHISESDRRAYVEEQEEFFRAGTFPEERSVPVGEPYKMEVDDGIFKKLKASKCGIHEYPDCAPC